MPTARAALAAARGSDGKIYVVGGMSDAGVALGTLEAFDPKTNTWQVLNSMPTPRHSLAVVAADGGIYAIGGSDGLYARDEVEVYSVSSGTWSLVGRVRTPVYRHGVVIGQGAGAGWYLIGGTPQAGGALSQADISLNGSTWSSWSGMGIGRTGHAAFAFGTCNVALGGKDNNGFLLSSAQCMQSGTATWSAWPGMLTARWLFGSVSDSAAALGAGGVFAIGGETSTGITGAAEYFNGSAWTALPSMPTPRSQLALACDASGRIYAIGGWNGSSLSSVQVLRTTPGSPPTGTWTP